MTTQNEWKTITAEDYCLQVADGTHDTPKPVAVGEYLVTSKHITGGKVDLSSAYRISKEDFEQINIRSKVDKWDVLITMIGTVGEVVLVDHDPNYAIKNIGLFKCGDELKAKWLKYYLQSPAGVTEIQSRIGGTTQEYIALGELRKLPISFPPITQQKAIVNALSNLDDKIDLLHHQNKTLESLASTLWRKMFIEDADKDWIETTIGEVITVKGGTTPSSANPTFWDGDIPWTSPRDLSSHDSVYLFDTSRKITKTGLAQIGSGLLPVGSVLLSSRAPIGYLVIADIEVAINQGYIGIICDKGISNYYMYMWIRHNMDTIIGAANGSTFLEISKSVFKELEFVMPDNKILEEYDCKVTPIFQKIKANQKDICSISKLRDTLLPKLMSGEVKG